MKAVWKDKIQYQNDKALDFAMTYDVIVIGAGMAGLLCAYMLQKEKNVIVLEASQIASGQTGKTTAKITSQHGLIYDKLVSQTSFEKAKEYAFYNQKAIDEYEKLIADKKIDCDFKRNNAYLYTLQDDQTLEKELTAANMVGIDATMETHTELPFSVKKALKFPNQAQFNPMKFIQGIVATLCIYENTPVLKVIDNEVYLEKGVLKANHIIFATHFPFINHPGYYFMRMHQERSYVIALNSVPAMEDTYYGIDEDGYSFRTYDKYLLFGGGNHRCGENKKGGKYVQLKKQAFTYFPQANVKYEWSAQDCMSIDQIPYIGYYATNHNSWYVATGFNKWGMTSSMVSAMILRDMICDGKEEVTVFSPARFNIASSASNILKDTLHSIKGLGKGMFALPEKLLSELPLSHGGIVEYQHQKVGVYKDAEGITFMVDTNCPHLGCQLEWNPDELSWDCPCHGSRFTYTGDLIDNPAQVSLHFEKNSDS